MKNPAFCKSHVHDTSNARNILDDYVKSEFKSTANEVCIMLEFGLDISILNSSIYLNFRNIILKLITRLNFE